MSTKQPFLENLHNNWFAMLVCTVIAIFVVFLHNTASVEYKVFSVPLNVIQNGMMVQASDLGENRYVKVSVRGQKENIQQITESDISAYVDISSITEEGYMSLPVFILPTPKLLVMESLEITPKPERVKFKVEKKIFDYVTVEPTIFGQPAHGWEIESVSVDPDNLRITGARSMVDATKTLYTSRVNVSNLQENLEEVVRVFNDNSYILLDDEDTVKVKVTFVETVNEVVYENIPLSLKNISPLVEAKVIGNPGINITVSGTVNTLEKLKSLSFSAWVDCSEFVQDGEFSGNVNISLPSGQKLTLVNQNLQSVPIEVKLIPQEEEIEVEEEFVEIEELVEEE